MRTHPETGAPLRSLTLNAQTWVRTVASLTTDPDVAIVSLSMLHGGEAEQMVAPGHWGSVGIVLGHALKRLLDGVAVCLAITVARMAGLDGVAGMFIGAVIGMEGMKTCLQAMQWIMVRWIAGRDQDGPEA